MELSRNSLLKSIFLLFVIEISSTAIIANIPDLSSFNTRYPGNKMAGCSLCHTSPPALNTYGADFKAAGRNAAAFTLIENRDSDGDGFSNLQEIQSGSYPGDPSSKPALLFTNTLEFAHFVVGGTWRSYIVLNSIAAGDISAIIDFTGQDGKPMALEVNGAIAKSSYSTTIPKDGFLKLSLGHSGSSNSKSGWARVSTTGNVGGTLVYQYLANAVVKSQATVLPSIRTKKFRMSLPQLGMLTDSGLAFTNVSTNPNLVTIRYYLPDGRMAAASGLESLAAGAQVTMMIWQVMASFPQSQEGTLEVVSTEDLIAVGLKGVNSWNSFTTVPVISVP